MLKINNKSLNQPLPRIFVDKVLLEPTTEALENPQMKLSIDLSLEKEQVETPWYLDDGIKGRLRILLCLVRNKMIVSALSSSKKRLVREIVNEKNKKGLTKLFFGLENSAISPLDSLSEGSIEVLNTETGFSSEGLSYKVTAFLKETPSYLCCLAVPYLADINDSSKSGMSPETIPVCGEICIENIISNGKTPASSFAFKLAEDSVVGSVGEAWIGPVSYHPEEGFVGSANSTDALSPKLMAEVVANKKIVDMRFLKSLAALDPSNFSGVSPETISIQAEKFLEATRTIHNLSYFSPLYLSQSDSSINLMIGFNIIEAVRNLTKFPQLYHSTEELKSAITLNDIVIYRKRVLQPPLGNRLTGGQIFNRPTEQNAEEVIIGSLTQGTVSILEYGVNSHVVHFVSSDPSMNTITDGLYQYGVHIRFADNTAIKLKNVISFLDEATHQYDIFLNLLNNPKAYDYVRDRFNPKHVEQIKAESTAWSDLVNKYMVAVRLIFGSAPFISQKSAEWQRNLLNMTDPETATTKSLYQVRKMARDLISKVSFIINKTPVGNTGMAQSFRSTIDSTDENQGLLEMRHNFSDTHNARDTMNQGLSYLFSSKNSPDFYTLSFKDWNSRIKTEASRYGAVTNTPSSTVTSTAFLSPLTIKTPNKNIKVNPGMKFDDSLIILNGKANPCRKEMGVRSVSPSAIASQKQSLLGFHGITIAPLKGGISGFGNEKIIKTLTVDSGKVLGDGSKFPRAKEEPPNPSDPSNEINFKGTKNPEENIMNSNLALSLLDEVSQKFTLPSLTRPGLGRSAYAMQKLRNEPTLIETQNSFDINLNYNSIVACEYLAGYKVIDGATYVCSPIWALLNEKTFKSASKSKFLFCRMSRTPSILEQENVYEEALPIINKYFMIGTPTISTTVTSRSNAKKKSNIEARAKRLENKMSQPTIAKTAGKLPRRYLYSTGMIKKEMIKKGNGGTSNGGGY